jgi:hypothetical protein
MRGNAHVRFGSRAGERTNRKADTAPRPDLTRWPGSPPAAGPDEPGLRNGCSCKRGP